MEKLLARMQGRSAALLVLGLGSATLALFMIALIGFFSLGHDSDGSTDLTAGPTVESGPGGTTATNPDVVAPGDTTGATDPTGTVAGPGGTKPGAKGTGPTGTTTPTGPGGTPFVPERNDPGEAPLPTGGNATGVSATHIKYGVHAPITFAKAPVPLAGPVVRGIRTYTEFINTTGGGINGRKIDLKIADDEFTTTGAETAATKLINEDKVFFVAGTLGVDQIKVVADSAKAAKVPYFAGGGHEPYFKDMGVHQILSSYNTHVIQLADYLATDPDYKGKVVGTMTSDTPQIAPIVTVFDNALKKHGMSVKVNQTVQKPEVQNALGYDPQILEFKKGGVQVLVPLTDPINTSGLVRQCGYNNQNTCPWTYSFSNFAHDGETALTLFNDEWGRKKVRGLSGGCYPLAAEVENPAKCASMKTARDQFNAQKGKADAWTTQQTDADGSSLGYNSAPGYQWMFWKKAMIDQGSSVTRERFLAAIHRYNGYADLVTGPITYKGSSNYAHGAEKMTVFEAQLTNKYKMVSGGMVDGF